MCSWPSKYSQSSPASSRNATSWFSQTSYSMRCFLRSYSNPFWISHLMAVSVPTRLWERTFCPCCFIICLLLSQSMRFRTSWKATLDSVSLALPASMCPSSPSSRMMIRPSHRRELQKTLRKAKSNQRRRISRAPKLTTKIPTPKTKTRTKKKVAVKWTNAVQCNGHKRQSWHLYRIKRGCLRRKTSTQSSSISSQMRSRIWTACWVSRRCQRWRELNSTSCSPRSSRWTRRWLMRKLANRKFWIISWSTTAHTTTTPTSWSYSTA